MPSLRSRFARLPRLLRVIVKVSITTAIFAALLLRFDVQAVSVRIGSIGFGASAVCLVIILFLSIAVAVRWHVILARMTIRIRFAECWRLVMIGLFFNQTLPSGIGGDAVRLGLMVRQGHRLRTALVSVATDRIFALAALVVCMVGALPSLIGGPVFAPVLALSVAGTLGFFALLSFDAALTLLGHISPKLAAPRSPTILTRTINLIRDLSRAVLGVSRSLTDGPLVLLLSVVNQLALGLIVYLIAHALGVEIGLVDTLILFPPAMLLSMAPVSFGGWGVREVAIVWLFGTVGVPAESALGISILFGLITTAAGLPGGVFWLLEWLKSTPDRFDNAPLQEMDVAGTPRILARSTSIVSPWMRLVERKVDVGAGRIEKYHAIDQSDYVGILAVTPEGLIPIVRQYRPALERFTCELPAGMVDPGEDAEATCVRELCEETGLVARRVHPLGVHAADSARLSNYVHSFLVETETRGMAVGSEPEVEVEYVSFARLRALVLAGEFDLQYHVAIIGLALLRPETANFLGKGANTETATEGEGMRGTAKFSRTVVVS